MNLIDTRELLRIRDFDDAARVQRILCSTVSRICTTNDPRELRDYMAMAYECLSRMPLVREHFKLEVERRRREIVPVSPLIGESVR